MDTSKNLSIASAASAVLLASLCAMTLASGVSQQWFEWVRPPGEYAARLVHDAKWLRAIIAVDDVFIAAYVTATVLLATTLAKGKIGALHALVIAGGVAAGVLDLAENHHILSMLRVAESGEAIPLTEILHRSDASQLKWMLGHLSFVLVGVALPVRDAATRTLRGSLVAWQLPIGAIYWTLDGPVLTWLRYGSLLAGFAAIAWVTRGGARDGGGEAGSSAPA